MIDNDEDDNTPLFDMIFSEYKKNKEFSNNFHAIEKEEIKCWYDIDKHYHRDNDLPARIFQPDTVQADCGFMEWYLHGELHRDNSKPAIVWDYGCEWWVNGVRHREDGPAVFEAAGENVKQWFLHGVEYSEDEFNALQEKKQLSVTIEDSQKMIPKIKL